MTEVTRRPQDLNPRLAAAELAVTLALRLGDARTADVAEALLVDAPLDGPEHLLRHLRHLAATARAARRAIALARRTELDSPADLAALTVATPERLAKEILRTSAKNPHLATALLAVAKARHPGASALLSGEMDRIAENASLARVVFVR